jgi:hypothetical protein
MGLFIPGIFLILWGIATILIALIKPEKLWHMGKIQGFVKIMGDTGTMILLLVVDIVALGFGIWLVTAYLPL